MGLENVAVRPTDRAPLAAAIDPDAYAAGTVTSGWVSLVEYLQIMAVVMVGTLGSAATVDAKLEQATDGSGTGAKDITGKAITQLTKAAPNESDKQAIINCRADELDADNDFTHVRLSITVAVATSDAGGLVFGFDAHYAPEAAAASVAEIV